MRLCLSMGHKRLHDFGSSLDLQCMDLYEMIKCIVSVTQCLSLHVSLPASVVTKARKRCKEQLRKNFTCGRCILMIFDAV